MTHRIIKILLLAVTIAVCVSACAPAATAAPSVKATKPPAATAVPGPTQAPLPTSAPAGISGVVNFMTWAADSFELFALVKTVDSFVQKNPAIKVNCTIVTDPQSAQSLPSGSKTCKIITQ